MTKSEDTLSIGMPESITSKSATIPKLSAKEREKKLLSTLNASSEEVRETKSFQSIMKINQSHLSSYRAVRNTYNIIRMTNREIDRAPWQTFLRSIILQLRKIASFLVEFMSNRKNFLLLHLLIELSFCIIYLIEVQINMDDITLVSEVPLANYLRVYRSRTLYVTLLGLSAAVMYGILHRLIFVSLIPKLKTRLWIHSKIYLNGELFLISSRRCQF
jgi:hypothetical protein